MSEPTERIIELAKELHELGYRKNLNQGDWYLYTTKEAFSEGSEESLFLSSATGTTTIKDLEDEDKVGIFETLTIPIPSLSDGLEWLREYALYYDLRGSRYIISSLKFAYLDSQKEEKIDGWDDQELVLMAMVKVLEDSHE